MATILNAGTLEYLKEICAKATPGMRYLSEQDGTLMAEKYGEEAKEVGAFDFSSGDTEFLVTVHPQLVLDLVGKIEYLEERRAKLRDDLAVLASENDARRQSNEVCRQAQLDLENELLDFKAKASACVWARDEAIHAVDRLNAELAEAKAEVARWKAFENQEEGFANDLLTEKERLEKMVQRLLDERHQLAVNQTKLASVAHTLADGEMPPSATEVHALIDRLAKVTAARDSLAEIAEAATFAIDNATCDRCRDRIENVSVETIDALRKVGQ